MDHDYTQFDKIHDLGFWKFCTICYKLITSNLTNYVKLKMNNDHPQLTDYVKSKMNTDSYKNLLSSSLLCITIIILITTHLSPTKPLLYSNPNIDKNWIMRKNTNPTTYTTNQTSDYQDQM